jgi:hypothetical protein
VSEEKPRSMVALVAWWIGGILLALVLYVASTGPAQWLLENQWLPGEVLIPIYRPIGWVAESNECVAMHLRAYSLWWVGRE